MKTNDERGTMNDEQGRATALPFITLVPFIVHRSSFIVRS